MHDVQSVRGEDAVHLAHVPRRFGHLEGDRRTQVRRALIEDALAKSRHGIRNLGWLPDEPGHGDREMHGVLAGAAADFKHVLCSRRRLCAQASSRIGRLVALAGVASAADIRPVISAAASATARAPASASRPRAAAPAAHWMPFRPGAGIGRRRRSRRCRRRRRTREVREDVRVLAARAGEGEEREARERGEAFRIHGVQLRRCRRQP
jgi:hypothetical protein